ncbi:MAG: ABC transporter permease [Candidatus Omnitrophica bacterium]|nr:ABC transporter permease [Candidatus Omnitrophota bacterium]
MILKMAQKSLFANARNTLWILAALSVSASLIAMFATVSFDLEKKMTTALRKSGPNAAAFFHLQGAGREAQSGDWRTFRKIIRQRGIPAAWLSFEIVTVQGKPVILALADSKELARLTPSWFVMGSRPKEEGECMVGKRVADLWKLRLGEHLLMQSLRAGGSVKKMNCRITGFVLSGDENEDRIFVSHAPLEFRDFRLHSALLSIPQGEEGIQKMNQGLHESGISIEIKALREIVYGERATLKKIVLLSGTASLTVFILTVLGVSSALLSRILERKKELALLQAVGATGRSLGGFLLLEALLIAVTASVIGCAVGTLLSEWLARKIFYVSVTPQWITLPITFVITLIVSVIAAGLGVMRALSLEPAIALRGE